MEDVFHLGIKALIRDTKGQFLILKGNPKRDTDIYWDIPGGRIQVGDSIEDTLKREVKEETGIENIDIGPHIGIVMANIRLPIQITPSISSVGLILSVYECNVMETPRIKLSSEHAEYDWVSKADTVKRLAMKYPKEFIDIIESI